MTHVISFLLIVEFLLILYIFFKTLFKKGLTFKGGVAFGLLYFIFIPLWVMIFTGKLKIFKADFGRTDVNDIILADEIGNSFIMVSYIFALIIYLYSPLLIFKKKQLNHNFNLKIKGVVYIYLITLAIIFIGSGLLEGGNWYHNRNNFFKESGSIAVLIAFIYNAAKILIISAIIYYWYIGRLKLFHFLIAVFGFTFFDMFVSGNRIYLFTMITIVALLFIKKYPIKSLIVTPILLPLVFFVGYFVSIFRHMRAPLFSQGIPDFNIFMYSLKRAMKIDPPRLDNFIINITESINVNVIYDIFESYERTLYGATYLKTLFFYVPRSIWESKPESITVIAASVYGYSSLVTTIIGEMHMNFSYFGIILLPICLMFTESIINALSKDNVFYSIIAYFFGMLIFRMPYSDEVLVFLFLVVIVYFSNRKIKFVFRGK